MHARTSQSHTRVRACAHTHTHTHRLAEELVAAAQKSEQASDVINSMESLKKDMEELRTR